MHFMIMYGIVDLDANNVTHQRRIRFRRQQVVFHLKKENTSLELESVDCYRLIPGTLFIRKKIDPTREIWTKTA